MTHEDKGHYSKKHSADKKIRSDVKEAVQAKIKDGSILCSEAFRVKDQLEAEPSEIGFTIDMLEVRIKGCQLGLFGHKGGKTLKGMNEISVELKSEIESIMQDKRILCRDAWEIADRLNMKKLSVSSACEHMGIKIKGCQLGAF